LVLEFLEFYDANIFQLCVEDWRLLHESELAQLESARFLVAAGANIAAVRTDGVSVQTLAEMHCPAMVPLLQGTGAATDSMHAKSV
jgi:hypothetical protein